MNVWDVETGDNIRSLGSNKTSIECLCFAPSEQCIVSGSSSGSIKAFDLSEGRYRNLGGHKTAVTSIQYHPFSDFVASGSKDCLVKVWDVRNKECVSTYSGHEKEVTCVRFNPEGDWVASSGKDGLLLVFDMVAGKFGGVVEAITLYWWCLVHYSSDVLLSHPIVALVSHTTIILTSTLQPPSHHGRRKTPTNDALRSSVRHSVRVPPS